MIAIIAEKPSVGRDIARVVGATEEYKGYIQGNGYMVTWSFGHLVSLAYPEDYVDNIYIPSKLPIIPQQFKLIPRKIKAAKGYKTDMAAVKQLDVIKKVFSKCEKIIVATDAGREGELIFRYIYSYLKCRKPFQRLWISSLTDRAIVEGLSNLRDGKEYDNLYISAKARSQADWLVGINASQALCITSGQGNNSMGRVQTPTFAMICKRFYDFNNFKPEPYWQILLNVNIGETTIHAGSKEIYHDKTFADEIYNSVKQEEVVVVNKVSKTDIVEQPPLLYDLTELQKDANNKYGFSADYTLKLAQSLYEKKLLSYPRTGSRYITQDIFETIPDLIKSLRAYPELSKSAEYLSALKLHTIPVNSKKVTDHHALIITGENCSPQKLTENEKRIYELVAFRLLESFNLPCVKQSVSVSFILNEKEYVMSETLIKEHGWRNTDFSVDEKKNTNYDKLLSLKQGEPFKIESHNIVGKQTKPKPLFTEADLLSAMENAGDDIENAEERAAIRNTGLGTPATRAGIIETLLKREYIVREEKKLIPTKKGLFIYDSVKDMRISDIQLTANWESILQRMETKPEMYRSFMEKINHYCKQVVDEIISLRLTLKTDVETPHICPKCKRGKIKYLYKIARCKNSTCKLTVFRTKGEKYLNDANLNELFREGHTALIKGFKSSTGNTFNSRLGFDKSYNLIYVTKKKGK